MKTKIKSHRDEIKDFCDKEIPFVESNHTCLAVIISLDFALKKDENYYPQVFLTECNYIVKTVVSHSSDNMSGSFPSSESDEK